MKKRVICFLMAVVFALGLVPGASLAANNPEETQNGTEETVETQVPAEESADSIEEGPAIKGEMPTAYEEPTHVEPEEAIPSEESTLTIQSEEAVEETQPGTIQLLGTPADGVTYTRGEWMHELVALFGLTLTKDEYPDIYFPDIVGTTYFDDIMVATKFGLVSVEAGDDFRPDDPLTREFAAQTVNFYLGILNDKDSYTYSDTADVTFRDDAQVAVDQGWFVLSGGKFLPEQSVTAAESDKILADAAEFLARRNSTETKADFEFADWVKVLPDSADVQSEFDPETNAQTLTITGYDGTLAEGDTFVYYYQDFAFCFSVDTVTEKDGVYTVTVTDAPEGAVLKYEYTGTIQPDITGIIPDEEPVTLMTADGEVTFGPVQLMGSNGYYKDFSRPFTLPDGTKGNLTAKLSGVTVTAITKGGEIGFDLEGDLEVGSTVTLKLLDNPQATHIPLGEIGLGSFGHAGLSIDLTAQATLGFTYKAHFLIGASYYTDSGTTSTRKDWTASASNNISVDGTFSAMLSLGAYVSFAGSSASAEIKAGPILKAGFKFYPSGSPSRCFNADGYLYAAASADYVLKRPVTKKVESEGHWKYEFFNRTNSPIRFVRHLEDDVPVGSCTRKNDAGETKGDYMAGKYATPANSRYYDYASPNGSSTGYGGYGSEPVVIWTTKDNDDGTVTITGYKGNAAIVNIPETIDGKTVTKIGSRAFYKNKSITNIIMMPDSITTIESEAFYECTALSSVDISNNLAFLGTAAFYSCTSLSAIDIPCSLTTVRLSVIGTNSTNAPFSKCSSLKKVSFEDGITTIPANLFAGCTGLEKIIIPETVTEIGSYSFYDCINLKEAVLSDNLTELGIASFYNCISLTEISIPSSLTTARLSIIGGKDTNAPFSKCSNLRTVKFDETISRIPGNLFAGCIGLEAIAIPDSVTEIGPYAFSCCDNLKDIQLSNNLTSIETYAFYRSTALSKIELPEGLLQLGHRSFEGCTGLTYVYIPSTVKSRGVQPFIDCSSLNEVVFGDGTQVLHQYILSHCTGPLENVLIPDTVTTIEEAAFAFCSGMKTIDIPDSVQVIGPSAFSNSGLVSIVIPDTITEYSFGLFNNCKDLTTVKPSTHVNAISGSMFSGCSSLEDISWMMNTTISIGANAFNGCTSLTSFQAPNDLLTIGNNAFQGCTKLTDVDLNDGLQTVGSYAFQNCSALEKIILPDTVYFIGSYCFQKDTSLVDVTLSKDLTTIPAYTFANCTKLESLVIPKGVETIENNAFYQDTKLKTFTIPASVTSIGDNAFSYATTTTVNGVAGSYAETYAKWKAFNDVTKHADGLALASGKDSMTIDYRVGFTPTFVLDPADSTDLVTLTSDNESIISTEDGTYLYGLKKGTANITATTSGGKSITFPVTVDTATGIEVGHLPDKTEYNIGERKDRTGLVINQVFSNGDREQVFSYQLSGFDTKTTGEKTITVTRDKFTTTFPITVDKLATGKMGDHDELTWTYSSQSDQVTVTGPVSSAEPVLVASYDENGKMLSVDFITKPGDFGKADSQADMIKLFWVDESNTPKCACVDVTE